MKRDPSKRADLTQADPGSTDPTYWDRFHRSVTARASAALSRRRAVVPVSFTDLVVQWGRAAVPLAAAAAMLAGITLLQSGDEPPIEPVALEDVLTRGPDGVDLTGLSLQSAPEVAHLTGAEW